MCQVFLIFTLSSLLIPSFEIEDVNSYTDDIDSPNGPFRLAATARHLAYKHVHYGAHTPLPATIYNTLSRGLLRFTAIGDLSYVLKIDLDYFHVIH